MQQKREIMQTDIDQTHWYDRIWASFIFFTRLPFWRLHEPPKECYKTVVEHWPLTGWLTGGAMAATLYFGSVLMPQTIAVLLAIIVRLLMTGALHEDGLADIEYLVKKTVVTRCSIWRFCLEIIRCIISEYSESVSEVYEYYASFSQVLASVLRI